MNKKAYQVFGLIMSLVFFAHADQVTVYYDFIENGQLCGGQVSLWEDPFEAKAFTEMESTSSVMTIADNGPPANRVDLVIIGDGYTRSELPDYYIHAQQVTDTFFEEPLLSGYKSYFNIHRVDVISNESGVDEPDNEIYKDTALDMNFNCDNISRLLCININKARSAAANAPESDLIMALANSTRYGGAGYPNLFTLSVANNSAIELALHEFGHSFGKLGDEYHYDDGKVYTGSETITPNTSIYDISSQLDLQTKWYQWLDHPDVDTFEGALYCQYAIYRPMHNSKMRSLNRPFGPVNNEQIILNLYKQVSLIDDATPQSTDPLSGDTKFFVFTLQPSESTIDIQWYVDGKIIPDANDIFFIPTDHSLSLGLHDITVKVIDNTPKVRDENARAEWMTDTRQWKIEVTNSLSADLNKDNIVNLLDLLIMSSQWSAHPAVPSADIAPVSGGDALVNLSDFAVLASEWLYFNN